MSGREDGPRQPPGRGDAASRHAAPGQRAHARRVAPEGGRTGPLDAQGRGGDHGGGIDAARARWGGARADWLDLSTGINPVPWPLEADPPAPPGAARGVPPAVGRAPEGEALAGRLGACLDAGAWADAWRALPDAEAAARLERAARRLWRAPRGAAVLATPGASIAIALLPRLVPPGRAAIPGPTYNEHAAAFAAAGWAIESPPLAATAGAAAGGDRPGGDRRGRAILRAAAPAGEGGGAGAEAARAGQGRGASPHEPAPPSRGGRGGTGPLGAAVVVHPNNPDGWRWGACDIPPARLTVIDESFGDLDPEGSLIRLAARPGTVVLKSLGKFWGLAGLRLGMAIGDPPLLARLAQAMGPWPVSGPALALGARAIEDTAWGEAARARLARDARRLDALMAPHGAPAGGTSLFRLWRVRDARAFAGGLARARILVRTFPWSGELVRLGLPAPEGWARLEAALARPAPGG